MDEDIEMKDETTPSPIFIEKIIPKEEDKNQPFVEKYRPQKVNQIISQDFVISTIRKFLEKNSLTHLLFYGTAGTGKTTCAKVIANYLYGLENRAGNILELNASDERGIDIVKEQIKNFCQTLNSFGTFNYMPNKEDKIEEEKNQPSLIKEDYENGHLNKESYFKLVILDEADMMTVDAQSALRRIMEKYTNNVRFILICNQLSKIHPAVQSRTMRFRFMPIQKESCLSRIKEICKYENITYDNDDILRTLINLGEKDMRKMLNLLEATAMASKNNHITLDDIYTTAGLPSDKEFKEIIKDILGKEKNIGKIYEKVYRKILEKGFSIGDLIRLLHEYILKDKKISVSNSLECYRKLAILEKLVFKGGDEELIVQGFISLVRQFNLDYSK